MTLAGRPLLAKPSAVHPGELLPTAGSRTMRRRALLPLQQVADLQVKSFVTTRHRQTINAVRDEWKGSQSQCRYFRLS